MESARECRRAEPGSCADPVGAHPRPGAYQGIYGRDTEARQQPLPSPPESALRGDLMSPSPGALNASIGVVRDDGTELREGYAEVGDVRLHDVEAGDGPLIVLLHGFPGFWYGWRLKVAPLSAAGFGPSRPTPAATTCLRSRPASRPKALTSSPRHPRSHRRPRRTVRAG